MAFVQDSFTDANGTLLSSHAGEIGSSWTKLPNDTGTIQVTDANRIRHASVLDAEVGYSAIGAPASADYDVQADFFIASVVGVGNCQMQLVGRANLATPSGSENQYLVVYEDGASEGWILYKEVAGVFTSIGSFSETLGASSTHSGTLRMIGTAISVLRDGSQIIATTDSAISAIGSVGVRSYVSTLAGEMTNSTGVHLDNFLATNFDILLPQAMM